MLREPARLTGAAARVESDLRRTTNEPWTCTIGPDLRVVVDDGDTRHAAAVGGDVEDGDWFASAELGPVELSAALDADADEVIASTVAQVLQAPGLQWPTCEVHHRSMDACSGSWFCNGPPFHDVAAVGALQP